MEKAKKGEPVSTYQERLNQTPVNEGHWIGERGKSTFASNKDEVRNVFSSTAWLILFVNVFQNHLC